MTGPIRVIDLFAGPGGLGEGFSAHGDGQDFAIALSIEKDEIAHQTLRLRALFRHFKKTKVPEFYYEQLRTGKPDWEKLKSKFPIEVAIAEREAWNAELGSKSALPEEVDRRISSAILKA